MQYWGITLTNVTNKTTSAEMFHALKVAADQSVVFLVLVARMPFSSCSDKFGKRACCASFRFLCSCYLDCLREGRKLKNFGWSSIYCYHFPKLLHKELTQLKWNCTRHFTEHLKVVRTSWNSCFNFRRVSFENVWMMYDAWLADFIFRETWISERFRRDSWPEGSTWPVKNLNY